MHVFFNIQLMSGPSIERGNDEGNENNNCQDSKQVEGGDYSKRT